MHFGDMSGLLELLAKEREEARAQRSAAKPTATAAPQAAATQPAQRKRITPWQQAELEKLEARIPELETTLASCDAELAEPSLYTGPRAALDAARSKREKLQSELQAAYARWEELESLR